jgi:hypothetical protein
MQHIAFSGSASLIAATLRLSARATRSSVVAISGQKLHLFQMDWRMDKIARRNANCDNKRLFGLTYH